MGEPPFGSSACLSRPSTCHTGYQELPKKGEPSGRDYSANEIPLARRLSNQDRPRRNDDRQRHGRHPESRATVGVRRPRCRLHADRGRELLRELRLPPLRGLPCGLPRQLEHAFRVLDEVPPSRGGRCVQLHDDAGQAKFSIPGVPTASARTVNASDVPGAVFAAGSRTTVRVRRPSLHRCPAGLKIHGGATTLVWSLQSLPPTRRPVSG